MMILPLISKPAAPEITATAGLELELGALRSRIAALRAKI
jgi:hypothetical protein